MFLAFDAVGEELLAEGVADGSLPTMRRLLERGQYFPIEDSQELITPPSWPTLIRGCGPGEHLQMADRMLEPGTYAIRSVAAGHAERPPFWSHLSDAGLRSTIVSVYGAPLVPGLRGTQVIGWGSHDPFNGNVGGAQCEPPGVISELERLVGPRPPLFSKPLPEGRRETLRYLRQTLDGIARQGKALASLLGRRDYDFFFGTISECHHAGHLLWHYWRQSHPEHDPDAPPELVDGLRSIYRAVDRAYGEALERVDADAGVFLVSPYTMTSNHLLGHAVGPVLERGGWLRRRADAAPRTGLRAFGTLRAATPHALRRRLKRLVPLERRARLMNAMLLADVDWTATRAFPIPSDNSVAIRVNLAGREPSGTVQPGEEYDALIAELGAALLELADADTGAPVVERVATAEEAFGCAPRGPLPDLVAQWRRSEQVRAVRSPRLGEIEVTAEDEANTAMHRAPGFLLAAGPGIPASGHHRLEGPAIKLVDPGATALAWLGVPRPQSLSGAPIPPLARGAIRA